jgi:Flp pilus assembly protein TadB
MIRLAISLLILGLVIAHHAPLILVVILALLIALRFAHRTYRRRRRQLIRSMTQAPPHANALDGAIAGSSTNKTTDLVVAPTAAIPTSDRQYRRLARAAEG